MSKPEGIPQDVWAKAEDTLDTMLSNHDYEGWRADSIATIARAILAAKAEEREACEQVAMTFAARMKRFIDPKWSDALNAPFDSAQGAGHEIAEAIRKRGEG